MGNLATVLIVGLVCATFGFVAGSMLTSLWIDRYSRPAREPKKNPVKNENEVARILWNADTKSNELEINGKVYSSSHLPPEKVLGQLKSSISMFQQWFHKKADNQPVEKPVSRFEKKARIKTSKIQAEEKPEEHDMLFEINNLIQEKIKNSSGIESKIRLAREGATGVSFWVGEASYSSLDAIPDHQVRDLIKGAVAEWEAHAG